MLQITLTCAKCGSSALRTNGTSKGKSDDYARPRAEFSQPDYHHYGERVSTGFVESAVNQVVAKRLVKRQQMQWTKKDTYLFVQACTKVPNDE